MTTPRDKLPEWILMLLAMCGALSCQNGDATQSRPMPSASASPQIEAIASVQMPIAATGTGASPASPTTKAPRRNLPLSASASAISEALRGVGWAPSGSLKGSVKGVDCTTVLASREGMKAEVKIFTGYPYGLRDMLELRGTAQGFGEMTMITVLVKGDPAKTDELYEQLMGSAPERHGSGLGNSAVGD